MGILSIYRNLLSKSKLPTSHYPSSINLCFFRRILHAPSTVVGDVKPKSSSKNIMFLIDHIHEGINNYSLLSVAAENNKHHRISSPFSGRPAEYDLLGSCKEWILFRSYTKEVEYDLVGIFKEWILFEIFGKPFHNYDGELTLWNPTTNRIKTLPPSLLQRDHVYSIYNICFGFGFDPKSQDYKLIRGLKHEKRYGSDDGGEVDIELYSLKTDSWKQITAPPDVNVTRFRLRNTVHINGVHYWARDRIISFDFAEETFSHFYLPNFGRAHDYRNYCLAEFHGSLAAIVPYWVPTEDLTDEENQPFSIEIWVWNGKTWNVGPRVAVGDFPVGASIGRVLGLFQNEYLFLQGEDEPEIMLFNCKTGKLENLGIHHDPPFSTDARAGIFPCSVPI